MSKGRGVKEDGDLICTKTCPHCGGKLVGTINPSKLMCTFCGRIIPNFHYLSKFRRMKLKSIERFC